MIGTNGLLRNADLNPFAVTFETVLDVVVVLVDFLQVDFFDQVVVENQSWLLVIDMNMNIHFGSIWLADHDELPILISELGALGEILRSLPYWIVIRPSFPFRDPVLAGSQVLRA